MAYFAIIKNDVVENFIVADNADDAKKYTNAHEVIETEAIGVGWFRVNGEWHEPVVADENPEAND